MNERLKDVLEGKEENYMLPFYWQHGDHHEKIPASGLTGGISRLV